LTGLLNNQQYYWQVRAVNAGGNTQANAGTYWSFTTIAAAPGAFSKTIPTNGATGVATNPTLSWASSSGAISYEYCYATTTGCTNWVSTGTSTSVGLTDLLNDQQYFWQVRAVNAGGNTLANAGTYWSLTTIAAAPGAFSKTSPTNGAMGVSTNPTLSWDTSTDATSFEYCYDTTTGCMDWVSAGTSTSVELTGLGNNQEYYWQVRAVNAGGDTQANSGTYWSFTTIVAAPGAFSKTNPTNGATDVEVNLTFSWDTSTNATSYEYCYATTTGCTSWVSVGTNTSVDLTSLLNNQQYYWQVRAVNAGGNTQANAGIYWSFATKEEYIIFTIFMPFISK
jgi:protein involved in ribonucleotide reduction